MRSAAPVPNRRFFFHRISFDESGGVTVSTCLVRLKLRAEVPGAS